MCARQYAPVDMLMYYDARPNEFWNGMFDDTVVGRVLKGYYPFPMFNTLYRLGECNEVEDEAEIGGYICAVNNGNEGAVLFAHFNDGDNTEPKTFSIELSGFGGEHGTEVEFFLLDREHNCESFGRAIYYGDRFTPVLTLPNFTSYLIKMKKF